MNYLQKFPFDLLKIDRSFVASLGVSGNTGAIIQSIVTLGHALGMKVLAEGVERDEQRVLLRLPGATRCKATSSPGPATPPQSSAYWRARLVLRPPERGVPAADGAPAKSRFREETKFPRRG